MQNRASVNYVVLLLYQMYVRLQFILALLHCLAFTSSGDLKSKQVSPLTGHGDNVNKVTIPVRLRLPGTNQGKLKGSLLINAYITTFLCFFYFFYSIPTGYERKYYYCNMIMELHPISHQWLNGRGILLPDLHQAFIWLIIIIPFSTLD